MARKPQIEPVRRPTQVRDSSFTMRISTDLKDAMNTAAADDGRTMAQWLERLLISHLTQEGYLRRE